MVVCDENIKNNPNMDQESYFFEDWVKDVPQPVISSNDIRKRMKNKISVFYKTIGGLRLK